MQKDLLLTSTCLSSCLAEVVVVHDLQCKLGRHWMCVQRQLLHRFQREAEAARRDAAAFAEDKQRMEQELAYMRVITHTSAGM